MAALPYIQLYVADYLADTAHLNAEQHGAYLLLIMNYWQRGKRLDNRNERLANVCRMTSEQWKNNKHVLEEFFEILGDEWTHKRIEEDLAKVNEKSLKAREAGKLGGIRKKDSSKATAKQPLSKRQADDKLLPIYTDTEADTEKDKDQTTSSSTIHSLAQAFFALFAADGYYIDKVNGNPDTVDMVQAWVAAGVTVAEAKAVIEQTNAKRGKRPTSPTYYRDIVLDAKRAGIIVVNKNFHDEIKKIFSQILPEYPINVWSKKAEQDLQARINGNYEKFDFKKLKTWRNFFLIVKCSAHVKTHEWHLDYLIREEVFANILNNKRQIDLEQYKKLKEQYDNNYQGLN